MSGLLERIAAEKRALLNAGALDAVPDRPSAVGPVRDFRAAVRGGGIIAEIKRRSPSVETFPNAADPLAQARTYAANGATAISVVTDTPRFGMTLDDATAIREAGGLPVLVKDFVIDPRQVRAAWAAGADCVLLIARLVDVPTLRTLRLAAAELGVAALIECHDEADLRAALAAGGDLLGVNSRDLDTLELDLDTTRRLLRAKPADVLMVAESGLRTRADLLEMAALGADAFLIGGTLLTAPDPGRTLRHLTGEDS